MTRSKGATKFDQWVSTHSTMEAVQALKVSAGSLNNWRSGRTVPQWHHRSNIETLCQIPQEDWLALVEAAHVEGNA